jgi:hypothetical protein
VRCPKEIEDQGHEQVLTSERPAIVCERDRREYLRMDLAADPLRPAACTPSRSPARPGIFRQATELTKPQCDLFTARAIDPPKRIQELAATR